MRTRASAGSSDPMEPMQRRKDRDTGSRKARPQIVQSYDGAAKEAREARQQYSQRPSQTGLEIVSIARSLKPKSKLKLGVGC